MAMKKITRRWLVNGLGVIFVILLAVVIAFSVGIRSFYYSSVQQIIMSRSSVISTLLQTYAQDSSVNFSQELQNIVETFEYREQMELMAIDTAGNVMMTSSGFLPAEKLEMPDFEEMASSPDGIGIYPGRLNGENVMAVSVAFNSANENLAATRYVVSLERVDGQIHFLTAVVGLICLAIILFVVFSSSYFINSIVNPVSEIGSTARKIAQGDFKARLEKKNDDEIGELCDVINYMAEELANSEKLKNDFISSVSHELRTPLTAIRGWGETMLLDENIDRATLETGMGVIMRETERLSGMVEELLDFSRMQSGRMKLVMGKMDVLAELSEAVIMYTERARREGMLLIYDEPDIFVPVLGDRGKLRQVFINVIDNALKYSDPGDTTTVTARVMGNEIIIEVEDTGCGISQADLPKIKTKFYKANLTRRGSGIGLAVADEIVMMHGGRLDVSSVEGEGTTVTITLPIMERPGEDSTQISEAPTEPASPAVPEGLHLSKLDIDDGTGGGV
ncbi:MAG: HAMP domain-containing histidine kinase [Clostridiales bacterium]|nr:HAMP domain-containing histidine kinase [Clostridiales bacterium]